MAPQITWPATSSQRRNSRLLISAFGGFLGSPGPSNKYLRLEGITILKNVLPRFIKYSIESTQDLMPQKGVSVDLVMVFILYATMAYWYNRVFWVRVRGFQIEVRHARHQSHHQSKSPISGDESSPSGGIFDYRRTKKERLTEVLRELEDPKVWNDPERAQALGKERALLEAIVDNIEELTGGAGDAADLLEMAEEEDDEDTVDAVADDVARFEKRVAELEFRRMFSGEMDANSAFLDIQAGSGGTEAQDWAEMLLRMYLRWGEAMASRPN